jgi:hypothetical protein
MRIDHSYSPSVSGKPVCGALFARMPVLVMLFHYVSFPAADRRRLCYQQPLAGFTPAFNTGFYSAGT